MIVSPFMPATSEQRSCWRYLPFTAVVSKINVKTHKLKVTEYQPSGQYPIIDQGQDECIGYTNDPSVVIGECLPLVAFGDHTKTAKYIQRPFALGADGVVLLRPVDKLNTKFFYYWLRQASIRDLGYARHFSQLKSTQVPVPDMKEQECLANQLDNHLEAIGKTGAAAEAVLEAVKALPAAFLRQVFPQPGQPLFGGWRWAKLDEAFEFLDHRRRPVNEAERTKRIEGKPRDRLYPYYGANGQAGWIDDYLFDEPLVLLAEDGGAFGSGTTT